MKTISIQLRPETTAKLDHLSQRDGRPRSQYIRRVLEQHAVNISDAQQLCRADSLPKETKNGR